MVRVKLIHYLPYLPYNKNWLLVKMQNYVIAHPENFWKCNFSKLGI